MPEVHVIGEIIEGDGFGSGVSCKFRFEGGKHWSLLEGDTSGQTHVAYAELDDAAVWNHPIDLHFATSSIQGWPRMMLQVWKLDEFGRNSLQGYGFCHLPNCLGEAEMSVRCWRPMGSAQEEVATYFLDITPQLQSDDVLFNKAWDQRFRLVTAPSGTVTVRVNVLFRHMAEHNIDAPIA
ncbi:unnamed protein product [Chrysoparadoxa australica]